MSTGVTRLLLFQPWNDFMNCSGEEQERLLSLLEEEGARKKSASRLPKDGRNGDRPFVLVDVSLCVLRWLNSRLSTVHVAFSAQDCFQRIDRRLRATLRRKQIPLVCARACVCVCRSRFVEINPVCFVLLSGNPGITWEKHCGLLYCSAALGLHNHPRQQVEMALFIKKGFALRVCVKEFRKHTTVMIRVKVPPPGSGRVSKQAFLLCCLCSWTSFERLLLHAACQYMDLISASKRKDVHQTRLISQTWDCLCPLNLFMRLFFGFHAAHSAGTVT